nr:PREDICTED: uncharacterized protein LOC102358837 [Latimeria chalumnae]|eukprot:XP_005990536.2 PREDICTED: uncharacterized protein LOC102358837 [Latimeria chalumnae]
MAVCTGSDNKAGEENPTSVGNTAKTCRVKTSPTALVTDSAKVKSECFHYSETLTCRMNPFVSDTRRPDVSSPSVPGQQLGKRLNTDPEARENGTAQAMTSSETGSESEDCQSKISDSGHTRKRRKLRESTSKKIVKLLSQMQRDSVGLSERVLALEQQSLQKLSEISATLSSLASFITNTHQPSSFTQQPLPMVTGSFPFQIQGQMPQSHCFISPQSGIPQPIRSDHQN